MDAHYWHKVWTEDRIGFHQTRFNKRLEEHWPALGIDAATPVFVPLCGKSLDMLWLHERGHPVLGVELSAKAVQAFFDENGLAYDRRAEDGFEAFVGTGRASGIRLLAGDFFALERAALAHVGALYDRAALIALDGDLRADYAHHLANLLPTGTEGLVIAIDYDTARMQGPPFAVPDATVRELLGGAFDLEELAHYSGPERLGNLAGRGLDSLDERVYRVRRGAGAPFAVARKAPQDAPGTHG